MSILIYICGGGERHGVAVEGAEVVVPIALLGVLYGEQFAIEVEGEVLGDIGTTIGIGNVLIFVATCAVGSEDVVFGEI